MIAASTEGALDAAFWVRLGVGLSVYGVAVWFGLPRDVASASIVA